MDNRNFTLLTDFYEITMMQGYFKNHASNCVVFDLFYRQNPDDGAYAVCAGLAQVIDYVKSLHFDYEDIDYLRGLGVFDEDFLDYLASFHFTGYLCDSGRYRSLSARAAFKSCRTDFRGAVSGNSTLKSD